VQSHIRTCYKSDKKVWSHNRTFEKSNKSVLAQSHFWKEQMCENVQIKCKFLIVQIAKKAGLGNRPFFKCAIAFFKGQKSAISKFALFSHIFTHLLFWKNNCAIALCKVQKRGIWKLAKSAIAQLHFWKEQQKVRLHNCTFEKSKNVGCANVWLPNPGNNSMVWLKAYPEAGS